MHHHQHVCIGLNLLFPWNFLLACEMFVKRFKLSSSTLNWKCFFLFSRYARDWNVRFGNYCTWAKMTVELLVRERGMDRKGGLERRGEIHSREREGGRVIEGGENSRQPFASFLALGPLLPRMQYSRRVGKRELKSGLQLVLSLSPTGHLSVYDLKHDETVEIQKKKEQEEVGRRKKKEMSQDLQTQPGLWFNPDLLGFL